MKLLKCNVCGNIVEMIEDKGVPVMCCGKPMMELKSGTTDAATEKHVPVVEIIDSHLHVKVGSVEHPMLPEHFVTTIFVEFDNRVYRVNLNPGEKPEAVFALNGYKGKVVVYEYCNLHGLWKAELEA